MSCAYFVSFENAGLKAANASRFEPLPWWEQVPATPAGPWWNQVKTPAPVQAPTPAETEKPAANFFKRLFKGF